MADHGSRAHAAWSASASERLWNCPGSLALCEGLPDKESEAAAWGTACHQVAEKCLREGKDAVEFLGGTETTKAHSFEVDDEMAETAQVYVDYVREKSRGQSLLIEQKFSLAALKPPIEAGGTGDAVILDRANRHVEIVDLKGGRGVVVEAVGNKQLRTYALGAMLANPGPWDRVTVTIVQPRAPHKDGRIRSETFEAIDLFDWTADLLDAMKRATLAVAKQNAAMPTPWASTFLSAGDHCTFCKARATCPALQQKALAEAHTYLTPQGGLSVPPAPETLSTEQLVRILDHADMITNWLNAVRAFAQDQVEAGHEVAHGDSVYVLTPKRALRKWAVEDPVTALALRTNREPDEFYQEPKPMSPAMVEKLVGKKAYESLKDLVVAESSGFNLTRADKSSRPAVTGPAQTYLKPVE